MKTLYNYIFAECLGNLADENLFLGDKRRMAKGEPKRNSQSATAVKSFFILHLISNFFNV